MLFAVDDIKAAVADFKARGIQTDDDSKIDESQVCWMAFGQDSESNRFTVHQRKAG